MVGLSVFAGGADAANTRVSIGNFAWSNDPEIDLGEKVIWHWVGPDTAHSVTGAGPNGVLVDSDAGNNSPNHPLGDTFEYSFDQAGTYSFSCKLHATVRGTVTVSDRPGDPDSDPGPAPEVFWDEEAPQLDEVRPVDSRLGYKGKGGELSFAISERAVVDLEYFRLVKVGPKKRPRWVRRFAGFSEWQTFIGYNFVNYGAKSANFQSAPGRYVGLLRATDPSGNVTEPVKFRFEIAAPPKKKKKKR